MRPHENALTRVINCYKSWERLEGRPIALFQDAVSKDTHGDYKALIPSYFARQGQLIYKFFYICEIFFSLLGGGAKANDLFSVLSYNLFLVPEILV